MSGVSYKDRLVKNGLLPLTYWHEFLDMVYLYKALVLSNDHNIHVKTTDRLTRENDGTAKIILQVPRVNTLNFRTVITADHPGLLTVYHHTYGSQISQSVNLNAAYLNITKNLLKRSTTLMFHKRLKQCV